GHPVVTLVKYRGLPAHAGSMSDFDHYIVIAGLAGNDFIYNDAAYLGDRGYGLLISPGDLERAWDYSSIPRHGMAVSFKGGRGTAVGLDGGAAGDDGQSDDAMLPDEELLARSDVSLGDELRLQGACSALTLGRIVVGA